MAEPVVVTIEATWRSTHTFTVHDLEDQGVGIDEVRAYADQNGGQIHPELLEVVESNVASLVDWDVHIRERG